jgi:hypothetical protein
MRAYVRRRAYIIVKCVCYNSAMPIRYAANHYRQRVHRTMCQLEHMYLNTFGKYSNHGTSLCVTLLLKHV